jgi:3'-phosphoadenosine 5'-phosphosulfate sulfotransferase (PAPS reductase)/FAD synthetase
MAVIHVVSCSSGKDSDETLRQCLARVPKDRVRVVFADTDNEHDLAYEHLEYLERRHGIKVERLRADFSVELKAKRLFIARDVRTGRKYKRGPKFDHEGRPVWRRSKNGPVLMCPVACSDEDAFTDDGGTATHAPVQAIGYDGGRKVRWSNKAKRRALAAMHPSGNAFLDLCMWKGRFPSRKAQFCTQELKTAMLVQYQQALVEAGHRVVSWQGVRRDESANRRNAKLFERLQPRTYAYRPLVEWTALQVFGSLAANDIEPNKLYRLGMSRVGCMPCINVAKGELREIASRWPEVIDRITEWEQIVGACAKQGLSTFMVDAHQAKDRRQIFADLNIRARVEWAKTTRGGKQYDLLANNEELKACASAYGLCE